MRALVTGGAGFVGTNLIKKLLTDGHSVTSLDNYSTGKKENEQEGCKYFWVDLIDTMDFSWHMKNIDVIFHLGALARIQPSLKNPAEYITNNFNSTLHVLEYARQQNIKVVYAGSSSKHHGLYESPYAWSKYGGEELCKLYSNVYGVNTAICRFYNVYGPHHLREGAYATVIGIFEKLYMNNLPLTITSDGEQRRDFTHVDDIVDGIIKCSLQDFKGEEFEFGRGVNHSINELADMFGKEYDREYIPKRMGEYDITLCVDTKSKEVLGWEPSKDLQDYIIQFKESWKK